MSSIPVPIRRLCGALSAAALLFTLSACGGSDSGTQTAADRMREAGEDAADAAEDAGDAAADAADAAGDAAARAGEAAGNAAGAAAGAAGAAAQAAGNAAQATGQAAQQVATAGTGCEVPSGELRGTPDAGKQVYGMYCITCHGQGGKGDGPAAPASPKPADHTDPGRMGALSDQEIYKVIKCGGASVGKSPLMTPWGPVLNDQQIRDTLAFVRSLSKT